MIVAEVVEILLYCVNIGYYRLPYLKVLFCIFIRLKSFEQ